MKKKNSHAWLIIATTAISLFFGYTPTAQAAACSQDQFIPLAYPNDLMVVKNGDTNKVNTKYLTSATPLGTYFPNDKRPKTAPDNAGLIWIPKEACALDKVNLLIAYHGHRSLKYGDQTQEDKDNANIFLQSSGQKRFDLIVRDHLNQKKIVPMVIAGPMDDQGPKATVWNHPSDYTINTHITLIKKALSAKGINIDFSQVSVVGHSNANCGGGMARAAKELDGYKLYLYGAMDGTCGKINEHKEGYEAFFNQYNIFGTIASKGTFLFHMHQEYADTDAVTEIKQKYSGTLDPDAGNKDLYSEMWRSNDGKIFSYALTPGGDHDHTNAPMYFLKEVLPRFFSTAGNYDPSKHPVEAGKSSKNPNAKSPDGSPTDGASLWGAVKNTPLTDEEINKILQTPNPKIKIPGLDFSKITVESLKSQGDDGATYLGIPHLGEYIAAMYKYLVVIAAIICAIQLIISGFKWSLPDISGESKSSAKKTIVSSISGLVIAATSYTILYTINPELVQFNNLRVLFIQPEGAHADHTATSEAAESKGLIPPPSCTGKKLPSESTFGVPYFGPAEPYSCGNRNLSNVKYLVIHEGAVRDTAKFLASVGLSTHFVVNRDGTVQQAVDIRRSAGHAGSIINSWSIGVDMQMPTKEEIMSNAIPKKNFKNSKGQTLLGCNQSGACATNKECSSHCSYTPAQYEALNQLINVLVQKTGIRKNDQQIIAHCQIQYPTSAGHGDPRNFDWKKIGLNPDKHRQEQNYVTGRCIKTYTVNDYVENSKKTPKPKAVGPAGCCKILENEQLKYVNEARNQCEARKNGVDFAEESCI